MDSLSHESNDQINSEKIKQEVGLMISATLVDSKVFSRSYSDLTYLEPATLAKWLRQKMMTDLMLIDCRYPYEYEGGHIEGNNCKVVNLYTEQLITQALLDIPLQEVSRPSGLIVVFHCEYSECRGPAMYRFLRNQDRKANVESYPSLFYPHLYILVGGYNAFFSSFPDLCDGGYIQMNDKRYKQQMKSFKRKAHSPRLKM